MLSLQSSIAIHFTVVILLRFRRLITDDQLGSNAASRLLTLDVHEIEATRHRLNSLGALYVHTDFAHLNLLSISLTCI